MKYSLQTQQTQDFPLALGTNVLYACSDMQGMIAVTTDQQNATFSFLADNKSKMIEQQQKQLTDQSITIPLQEGIYRQLLVKVQLGQDQWILVYQQPFQVHFLLKKYKKTVKVELTQEINLQQLVCYVRYPDLLIYGHNPTTFTNQLLSLNLITLQIKHLTMSSYSPGNRSQYWSHASDSRLYLFGGVDQKGNCFQPLFWTYNMDNGSWFALSMSMEGEMIQGRWSNCWVQSGKVIVVGERGISLVELYQSRIGNIQVDEETQNKLRDVKGIFNFKGNIYLYAKQLIPLAFSLKKINSVK